MKEELLEFADALAPVVGKGKYVTIELPYENYERLCNELRGYEIDPNVKVGMPTAVTVMGFMIVQPKSA